MRFSSFLPRTRSKFIFVLVMASYGNAAKSLLSTIADSVGAQRAPIDNMLLQGHFIWEVAALLVISPVIESLFLIGMIELLRWVRGPVWLQVGLPALIMAAMHDPVSHAVIVTPAFLIMAGAYVMWKRGSRKSAFIIVASIHFFGNVGPAIGTVGYASRHNMFTHAIQPAAGPGQGAPESTK